MKGMVTPLSSWDNEDPRDNWIQTYTGRQFYPFKPEQSEVVIEDIAHHLSNICRFTGACRVHYSVAQHSVIVSQLVPTEFSLWGLLHDAEEAYLNDMASPVKPGFPEFKTVAQAVQVRILEQFGLSLPEPDCVKHADLIMVATESRDLMANAPTMWKLPVAPLSGLTVVPWTPDQAEREFLRRFEEVRKETSC